MNTNANTVVVDAVTAHNEAIVAKTQAEAVRLIGLITAEQTKVEGCNARIAARREALDKIAKEEVTITTVMGGSLPANSNTETITKVVEKANKERQYSVESRSTELVAAINNEQDAIRAIEKRIADLRAELLKLSAPVVTVDQIKG